METDISNKTIVVLVLLTVIISVLSTLVVLNEIINMDAASTPSAMAKTNSNGGSAQISLEIKPKQTDSATGRVTLTLKREGEQ